MLIVMTDDDKNPRERAGAESESGVGRHSKRAQDQVSIKELGKATGRFLAANRKHNELRQRLIGENEITT